MDTQTGSIHYTWIDYVKFLSIFLVVFYHCPPPFTHIPHLSLSLLRIPCFFFISGLLFRFEKYPSFLKFVKRRSKQLLVPYFCFFVIFYAYWLIIGKKTGLEADQNASLFQPLWEYLYGRPNLVCVPMWFVSCLFALQCIFYLLFRKVKNRIFALPILFSLPFVTVWVDLSNSPWMLDDVLRNIPFYGVACLFRKEIMDPVNFKKHLIPLCLSVILYMFSVYGLTFAENNYLDILLRLVGSFCILYPVIFIFKAITGFFVKSHFVEYISTNAIVVLACHTYPVRIIWIFIEKVLHKGPDFFDGQYLLKFLMATIILSAMIIPIFLINKYIPFMVGKGKYFSGS